MKTFQQELEQLINKHNMENGSNTPDYMLADYLVKCLEAYNQIIGFRTEWYDQPFTYDDIPREI